MRSFELTLWQVGGGVCVWVCRFERVCGMLGTRALGAVRARAGGER